MSVNLYPTAELADVQPATGVYYRLKLGKRSDNPSLVRSVTATAAGPSSGIQLTLTSGGSAIAWITDRLSGVDLTAAAWIFRVWAKESAAAANAALRFQILPFTTAEQAAAVDDNSGTELGTSTVESVVTSAAATATTMADGDRLVFKLLVDDAGMLGAGQTVTVSFNGQDPGAEGDSYVICPDGIALAASVPVATRTKIRNLLQDVDLTNPLLTDEQIGQALDFALREYSTDRPRLVVGAVSGDGSAVDFTLPRYWIAGFSTIRELEYPAGEQTRTVLATEDYEILESALGTQPTRKLHFPTITPDSGTDNLLVRYTTRHIHTDEADSVPPDDLGAVCLLAAAYGCAALAAKAAATEDPTINADSVERGGSTETRRFLDMAKEYRAAYGRLLGHEGAVSAGFVFHDWDTHFQQGRGDRLFHSKRWR